MSIALIGLACFLTWFSFRRQNILISLFAGLIWLGLAMWLFFGSTPVFDLSEQYAKILVWVFFGLTFVPFLALMDTEITMERKGSTWKVWGSPPSDKKTNYEEYRDRLRGMKSKYSRRRSLW